MGKVTKDRKALLREFLKAQVLERQANDAKTSYRKSQERILARKMALARKRAREREQKNQEELNKLLEPDTLLPNKEPLIQPIFDQKLAEVQQRLQTFAENDSNENLP